MTDVSTISIKAHRANIDRYRKLLAGKLTRVERDYIMRRIAEERAEIRRLEDAVDERVPNSIVAINPLADREMQAAALPWERRL